MTTIVTRAGKGSPLTHTEVDTNFTNLNSAKLETAAIPLGTLQAPSVSFLNDSDTGMFCPQGGNSLAIVTGGQYAITCSSTQAVGIKTANPQGALQVAGSTRIGANDATDAFLEIGEGATGNRNSYIDIVADTTYTDYGLRIIRNNTGANATSELKHRGTGALNFTTQEAAPIVFNTTNSPALTILAGGNVGIGTSSPDNPLHVATTLNRVIRATSSDTGATNSLLINNGSNYHYGALGNVSGTTLIGGDVYGLGYTASAGTDFTPVLSWTANTGLVGIGTTNPNQLLQINSTSIDARIQLTNSVTGSTNNDGFHLQMNNSVIYFDNKESGDFIFQSGANEAARIDSSRRLLVGTSTQQGDHCLQVQGSATAASYPGSIFLRRGLANASISSGNQLGVIDFGNQDGGKGATISAEGDAQWGASDYPSRLVFSTTADGASSPSPRMTIKENGSVFISCTSAPSASVKGVGWQNNSGVGFFYSSAVSLTSAVSHVEFINPNGVVGSISTNASATAYNTSSDYRLKENVAPVTDGIARLQQLKPSRFNFIADPDRVVDGFIAHEVQDIVPEAITGEKDAVDADGNLVYQGIDQSKLVPLLTAALQEAIGEIELLKARLTAAGL